MKKVGLIASLACLFTIGGVYATWTYASGGATADEGSLSPQMAGYGETSEKGTIHVNTDGLSLSIDQSNDSLKPYKPVLILSGHIRVWFTPNPGASELVKTEGISMELSITQPEGWTYDPNELDKSIPSTQTAIFSVDSSPVEINGGNRVLQSEGDPFLIPAADIEDYITLLVQEQIDTVAEWNYFNNLLENTHSDKFFTVTVSEI